MMSTQQREEAMSKTESLSGGGLQDCCLASQCQNQYLQEAGFRGKMSLTLAVGFLILPCFSIIHFAGNASDQKRIPSFKTRPAEESK
jgi:hypothetical protein